MSAYLSKSTMKWFLKIGLLVLSVFGATVAQADDNELLVKVAKENSKWVSFITAESQQIELSITDANDQVIFEQYTKTVRNQFKTYDLTELPAGEYTLAMRSNLKLTTYKIQINPESAILSAPTVVEIKKPLLSKTADMVTLDLNGTCQGQVSVTIYNEFNEKLHDDDFANERKVATKYDVSKTVSKELTFVIKSANKEFTETIKL
jgi:hypothetical protein